jgi:hypothetical protein
VVYFHLINLQIINVGRDQMTILFSIDTDISRGKEIFLDDALDATVSITTGKAVSVAPCCLRYGADHPLEATGLAMDAVARGTLIINYLFLVRTSKDKGRPFCVFGFFFLDCIVM